MTNNEGEVQRMADTIKALATLAKRMEQDDERRNRLIVQAREEGKMPAEIAAAARISRGRVHQIIRAARSSALTEVDERG